MSKLLHLRTQHLGPDELVVGGKIAFEPNLTAAALAIAINEVDCRVRAVAPIARPMDTEPTIFSEMPPEEET